MCYIGVMALTQKRNKYGAKPVVIGGRRYASKAEAKRGEELLLLERAGAISVLMFQPVFELAEAVSMDGRRKPALRYIADFSYNDSAGNLVVEDVKGVETDVFLSLIHI